MDPKLSKTIFFSLFTRDIIIIVSIITELATEDINFQSNKSMRYVKPMKVLILIQL